MGLRTYLTAAGARAVSGVCPSCGSDDVALSETMDGKVTGICKNCGHTWTGLYTTAHRDSPQPVSGVPGAPGTTDATGPPERPKLDDLPDALTPQQVDALVPGLDRDELYARLNAYDDWRRSKAWDQIGLPMPPAHLRDTMLPCHRFGGAAVDGGLVRGGRFMVPKAVVIRWFFDLREGGAMGDDDGTGG